MPVNDAEGSPPRVIFISNGHGEDEIAARIARAFLARRQAVRGHEVTGGQVGSGGEEAASNGHEAALAALPLVGLGGAYQRAGIPCIGPRRALPSGGLLMHSLPLFVADLQGGFLRLTAAQLRFLAGLRCEVLVVVGDVYAQLLATLVRARARFVVQTLVSAHHGQGQEPPAPHRVFMERITLPERVLMRGLAKRVYVRDRATEAALHQAGVAGASYLGNPVADELTGSAPASLDGERVVALLPGSRGYRLEALSRMLSVLELLADLDLVGAVAWVGANPEPPPDWEWRTVEADETGLAGELRKGRSRVLVYRDRFADVLHSARVVLGTAGTANEQAVALALPVVAFPVPPHYSSSFLANQKRLLGPALQIAPPEAGAIAEALRVWLEDPAKAELAGRQGQARIGGPGGSQAIAADILATTCEQGLCPSG